jgi:glycosyltransferase involved in cell wall biosynthesis
MISIIVPVYNVREYLPRCVESLLGQSVEDFEVILVDDGSTDGSGAICDRYAAQDARVRCIHKENGGLSSARNAGLDAATGDWILFVDGDDYLVTFALEQLTALAGVHAEADFIHFLYRETADGTWQGEIETPNIQISTKPEDMFYWQYALGGEGSSACTKLFRRELFRDLRFAEGIRHEDEELMTRLLPRCHRAVYMDLELYGYVMRSGSIIRSNFHPGSLDIFPIMDQRVEMLQSFGLEELVRDTKTRMFRTAAWLYCKAKRAGFRQEAATLKSRILEGAKTDLDLVGQYQILHSLARYIPFAPELYYLTRRLFGKT